MEKTWKFQIVSVGPTNLCQHSTTDLARGIMPNECKQSVLSKARSFKHLNKKKLQHFWIQLITNEQVILVSFTWEGLISRFLILAVPLIRAMWEYQCTINTFSWPSSCRPWTGRLDLLTENKVLRDGNIVLLLGCFCGMMKTQGTQNS